MDNVQLPEVSEKIFSDMRLVNLLLDLLEKGPVTKTTLLELMDNFCSYYDSGRLCAEAMDICECVILRIRKLLK